MPSKIVLREQMKRRRKELSRSEAKERSKLILEQLFLLPDFFRADVIHTYISSLNNEADTHEMIRLVLKQKKRVIVPIADAGTKSMRHSEIFSLGELAAGAYGILEPKMVRPVAVQELQTVIVPAVAVDRNGNRLGFGAGYYDRFLHDVQLPSIALAYEFQIVDSVPVEKTDVPVRYIVTENEIIRCRN